MAGILKRVGCYHRATPRFNIHYFQCVATAVHGVTGPFQARGQGRTIEFRSHSSPLCLKLDCFWRRHKPKLGGILRKIYLPIPRRKTMQQSAYKQIAQNPKFKELVSSRSSFAWTLSIIMLAVYQGFILLVAYAKGFLATPLAAGVVTTIGIPIGLGVIITAFVLTGIYVARANGRYDELTRELTQEVTK
jgi:uncharacterized membrane protein (DUF485 family)